MIARVRDVETVGRGIKDEATGEVEPRRGGAVAVH